ncbi:MAG: HXXEE domain-containing protein [Prevotellaceae bacterium]|jgi:hypothetical protein|nr:HXXEE domain-containing protein [Prevotellaceae bacterium]
MKWFIENWYKSTFFLAIYSLLFIFLFILPKDFALFLIWLHVPVYLLHETEEFVFPGGFPDIMTEMFIGKGKEVPLAIKRAGFWINIPFIVIGFPFVATLATLLGVSFGLYVVYFTLIATIPHFIQVIRTKKLYNPGLAASVFLNLPVSIFTLYYLNSKGLVSNWANIIGFVVAFVAMAGPMVFQLKKAIAETRKTETNINK